MHLLELQAKKRQFHLLANAHTASFYTSKRYSHDFMIKESKKINKISGKINSFSLTDKFTISNINNQIRSPIVSSNFTLKQIHHKLTQILQPKNNNENSLLFQSNPQKRQNKFKITMLHKFKKKQNQQQIIRNSSSKNNQSLNKDFRIKQACIQQRESLKLTQQSERIGFKRDFLRYHGENKCFERALKFRNKLGLSQTKNKNNPSLMLLQLEKRDLFKQNSLEYSSEDIDLIEMQAWNKQSKYVQQQMQISFHENMA